eukprot:scaffold4162_cov162-Amphora_coffeaeformis.AAC.13
MRYSYMISKSTVQSSPNQLSGTFFFNCRTNTISVDTHSIMSTISSPQRNSAPQLLFDDGSRAIQEDNDPFSSSSSSFSTPARDPSISIREYYEIDRLVQELCDLREHSTDWQDRIALQFPDELLMDAPEVCWEFEQSLSSSSSSSSSSNAVLIFVLGDTTYQSCCPDVVAARHLNADCIVHYGHACLSHATLPVLYSFGKQALSVDATVQAILQQKQEEDSTQTTSENLLVLYEVKYAHAMEALQEALRPHFQSVMMGRIPSSHATASTSSPSCEQSNCGCAVKMSTSSIEATVVDDTSLPKKTSSVETTEDVPTDAMILGGLEIPHCENWSKTTLLFVGQEEASRPLQNIMLRFLTDTEHAPAAYWTWNPVTEALSTQASSHLSRLLNRRFYLVQKAKLARVFGILVANPSDSTTRPVVRHLQALLQAHGAAQYNFMVGKVNPNKLANFAEVDAFCLVASEAIKESSGKAGGSSGENHGDDEDDNYDDDDGDNDAPYFNPVTGRYESAMKKEDDTINLQVLPGRGQLTTYQSAAADFLRQREYQGLSVDAGETPVQAATRGQQGIASNYGNQ